MSLSAIETKLINFMEDYGITCLRVCLGTVFIWFGLLKIFHVSPIQDLVSHFLYWVPGDPVLYMGILETVIGLGLLFRFFLRFVLVLFWLQMFGTLLLFVCMPWVTFQRDNPLILTLEGEFILKNLVLIAAGLVVGSTIRRQSEDIK